jgi:hypothetical protein
MRDGQMGANERCGMHDARTRCRPCSNNGNNNNNNSSSSKQTTRINLAEIRFTGL